MGCGVLQTANYYLPKEVRTMTDQDIIILIANEDEDHDGPIVVGPYCSDVC